MKKFMIAICFTMASSGCATIVESPLEDIQFETTQKTIQDIRIELSNGMHCDNVPCKLTVSKWFSGHVIAKRDGCPDRKLLINSKMERGKVETYFFTNLFTNLLILYPIDLLTGALRTMTPTHIEIDDFVCDAYPIEQQGSEVSLEYLKIETKK